MIFSIGAKWWDIMRTKRAPISHRGQKLSHVLECVCRLGSEIVWEDNKNDYIQTPRLTFYSIQASLNNE